MVLSMPLGIVVLLVDHTLKMGFILEPGKRPQVKGHFETKQHGHGDETSETTTNKRRNVC